MLLYLIAFFPNCDFMLLTRNEKISSENTDQRMFNSTQPASFHFNWLSKNINQYFNHYPTSVLNMTNILYNPICMHVDQSDSRTVYWNILDII